MFCFRRKWNFLNLYNVKTYLDPSDLRLCSGRKEILMNETPKRERRHYSSDQKVLILRELLENNIPISQLAEKYNVHVNDIYNWKKKLF
ncbi:MAG: transposase, partial [Ignavibacteria bacterium]|nr:transposase [Ignavibacteria bacterium]